MVREAISTLDLEIAFERGKQQNNQLLTPKNGLLLF